MLGKRHDNLLRAIRKYITQLGDEAPKYFSEDPDKGGRLYHITKAGCDLMAGRIIGAQSEVFKAKYVRYFTRVYGNTRTIYLNQLTHFHRSGRNL